MVHYLVLYRLAKGTSEEEIEAMIRLSRTCFHRVNEARSFRSGRNLSKDEEYGFFIAADFESREKLRMFREDPAYRRFQDEAVEPHTVEQRELLFETDPGKDPKYS